MQSNVYPVVPLRNEVITVTDAVPVSEEIDLALDFTENMVYDIMEVETWIDPVAVDVTVATGGSVDIDFALLDNPASVANLGTPAVFETAPEVIYYAHATWLFAKDAVPTSHSLVRADMYHTHKFDEPFTVARNLLISLVANTGGGLMFANAFTGRMIVWGRKRKASDKEFKDILYRQRY